MKKLNTPPPQKKYCFRKFQLNQFCVPKLNKEESTSLDNLITEKEV